MLDIAALLARRGTCLRKQVGCVIVDRNYRILATGYNGQIRGYAHCDHYKPCPAYANATVSCEAIHAEMNALMQCSDITKIFKVYVTHEPCTKCFLMISNTSCEGIVVTPSIEEDANDLPTTV
jgi:dCMP deaminase